MRRLVQQAYRYHRGKMWYPWNSLVDVFPGQKKFSGILFIISRFYFHFRGNPRPIPIPGGMKATTAQSCQWYFPLQQAISSSRILTRWQGFSERSKRTTTITSLSHLEEASWEERSRSPSLAFTRWQGFNERSKRTTTITSLSHPKEVSWEERNRSLSLACADRSV
jgi:hypothetical protein